MPASVFMYMYTSVLLFYVLFIIIELSPETLSQILQDALNGEESDVVFAQFYSLVPLGKLMQDCTVLYVWPSASMCESLLHRDCCVAW